MPLIVGVRFRPVTKIYYFDPNEVEELEPEVRVIVETSRGMEMGVVVQPAHEVPKSELKGPLKRVLRKATPIDLIQVERYRAEEEDALSRCDILAKEMEMPIRVIKADYNFDGSRLMFSFTAEQRVDFRDLVKGLTKQFSTRIEMKQVGARDETKILDGYGRCGRRLCCSSWLTEFHPVSIKMAKNQGLPLAPAEISGVCGRLLCCLAYENEQYSTLREAMPKVGTQVRSPENNGVGVIRGLNILSESVLVHFEEGEGFVELPVSELKLLDDHQESPPDPKVERKSRRRKRKKKERSEQNTNDATD
ncbi:MAG TPA: regulatory iron-sulfur-containing complex subunit RicT [Anaerolineae bacterium]|nr:stage 0 sporulation protein [Anaerolineae bacterium]MCB0182266.1 stage 0 sporulation protein [Anaerolineae bacterium]HRV95748.1 regulatory iron-sulfur-containing complex subunit RicT [Anaerolineae bacterium]